MVAAGCTPLLSSNGAGAKPVVIIRSTYGVSRNRDFIDRLSVDSHKFEHITDRVSLAWATMDVNHNTDISRRQSEIGQVSR